MASHWIAPNPGSLKINTHGVWSSIPSDIGNHSGIGAVYRDSNGTLSHVTVGTIPFLSRLGTQLWAIYAPLRRAMIKGYSSVILETDNYQAYRVIRDFQHGAPAEVFDIVSQIDILLKDRRWTCVIAYVYPARNHVARFTARLGKDVADRLYTLNRMIGPLEELLDWDMGLGVDHPDFMDVVLPDEAPDPVNFDVALGIADQVDGLALGQLHFQGGMAPAAMQGGAPASQPMENGGMHANAATGMVDEDAVGPQEETIQPTLRDTGFLFAGDSPLEDVD